MAFPRKYLVVISVFLGACLILIACIYYILVGQKLGDLRPMSRAAVASVLKAQYWNSFTGGYWENEMLRQAENIARLPLVERLDFYRAIILYCNLDTSRSILFIESVGDDANALGANLRTFQDSPQYSKLAKQQQLRIDNWLHEIQIINGKDRS